MKIKIMLDEEAIKPSRAHKVDAGLDLYSPHDWTLGARNSNIVDYVTIDTGVHIQIPEGYVGFVKSKSGLMVKNNIVTDGTVDSGYTGSIKVKLFNHSYSEDYNIKRGDKIAQLVLLPIITPDLELVDEFEATDRGDKGFGSTGR